MRCFCFQGSRISVADNAALCGLLWLLLNCHLHCVSLLGTAASEWRLTRSPELLQGSHNCRRRPQQNHTPFTARHNNNRQHTPTQHSTISPDHCFQVASAAVRSLLSASKRATILLPPQYCNLTIRHTQSLISSHTQHTQQQAKHAHVRVGSSSVGDATPPMCLMRCA